MNIFKAFAHIGPLINNNVGGVAPVGELAPMSITFTREKTYHSHADFPNLTLVGFSYKINDVAENVTDQIAFECLKAINWTYNQARLGSFTNQKDSFQQKFILQWGTTFDLIDSGTMVAFDNYWCPEYIEFCPKGQSANILWRVWFSNDAFFNQFDESTILVVPPLNNLDQFFADANTVGALVAGITTTSIVSKVDALKGNFPYTVLRADNFDWVDPIDPTNRIPVTWPTIIYGMAGDNLDSVKEAIRTYILANSNRPRDDWATIFPDLFTSTEYIVTPFWNKYAVPNATRDLGIFAASTSVQEAMALTHLTCKGVGYNNAHIDGVLSITSSLYRSINLGIVGGPENRDGIDLFYERYPDYINVPTTHPDFMRMQEETRQFVLLLTEMIGHAESLTPNSGIPQGFNRLTRDGVVYLAATFKNFLWLVVTKYSVDALTDGD